MTTKDVPLVTNLVRVLYGTAVAGAFAPWRAAARLWPGTGWGH